MQSSSQVSIVGTALVSSLSSRAEVACAAARVGLRRTRRSGYAVVNAELDREFLSVHASYPLTEGFSGELRLLRMLQSALGDLWRDECLPAGAAQRRIGLYLGLPQQHRELSGLAWIADDAVRGEREARAKARPAKLDSQQRGRQLLRRACQLAGIEPNWQLTRFVEGGHDASAECMKLALADLQSGALELAVVGGIDSLLDDSTLRWLEDTSRLKTPALPVGLEAGEACGLLLLEPRHATLSRRAKPRATIVCLAHAIDDKPYTELEPATGTGYSALLGQLSAHAAWSGGDAPWLLVDQNGEVKRASDWANALVRVQASQPWFANARTTYPVVSFGDSCAASGAVNACLAVSAFTRRWAPARTAAVISAAENGRRAALLLRDERS